MSRYTAPKPKELLHIRYAAFTPKEPKSRAKTAATNETVPTSIIHPEINKSKNKSNDIKPEAKATPPSALNSPSNLVKPTSSQAQRKTFSGTCKLCGVPGHRAFHCPSRNGKLVCYRCGELDVMYPHCTRCQARKEIAENLKKSTELSPTSAH